MQILGMYTKKNSYFIGYDYRCKLPVSYFISYFFISEWDGKSTSTTA